MEEKVKALRKTLRRIYKYNPIYKDKMDKVGIKPNDIKSLDDLSKLPLTTKKDFFKDYPEGFYCVDKKDIMVYHSSSGTTGKPLIVGLTKKDMQLRDKMCKDSTEIMGITKDDIVQICLGFGMFTGGLTFYEGLKKYGCQIIPAATVSTEMQLFYMENLRPTVLVSSPSQVMHIYEVSRKLGIDVKKIPLKNIRVGSELLTEAMRKKIKKAYGEDVSVTQDYGMTETLGPGIGMECTEESGLHLSEYYTYELVDPKTKEPTEKNVGELVVTSLYNEAFPIIRYCTNDIVEISKEPCSCGNITPRIVKFIGRSDDMIKIKGVKVFLSQVEDFLMNYDFLNHQYEIILTNENFKDKITINAEYFIDLNKEELEVLEKRKKNIEKAFKSEFGIFASINLLTTNSIEIKPGKVKRVKDLREV